MPPAVIYAAVVVVVGGYGTGYIAMECGPRGRITDPTTTIRTARRSANFFSFPVNRVGSEHRLTRRETIPDGGGGGGDSLW